MNILVSNDDGIYRKGIKELVAALSQIEGANIYVFAPDKERTAAGHGITIRGSLYVEAWDEPEYAVAKQAFSCSGKPADCVKIGVALLKKQGIDIDLVCTGINHGSNVGSDYYYSGTVAGALEGLLLRIPSIAFSLCSSKSTDFEAFRSIVPEVVTKSLGKIPKDTLLNVNVPPVPKDEIKGIIVTHMDLKEYADAYKPVQKTEKGTYYEYYWEDSQPSTNDLSTDVKGIEAGYVTIVPISLTKTDPAQVKVCQSWGIGDHV